MTSASASMAMQTHGGTALRCLTTSRYRCAWVRDGSGDVSSLPPLLGVLLHCPRPQLLGAHMRSISRWMLSVALAALGFVDSMLQDWVHARCWDLGASWAPNASALACWAAATMQQAPARCHSLAATCCLWKCVCTATRKLVCARRAAPVLGVAHATMRRSRRFSLCAAVMLHR